jgi:hypothetical protein
MTTVWDLAEQLEIETQDAGMNLGFAFDFTEMANVETLPDTLPSKAAMLELLGGYSYTKAVEKLSRSECYLYLGHAKKWHKAAFDNSEAVQFAKGLAQDVGKKFNLSGVPTAILRNMVLDIYPESLPTLISQAKATPTTAVAVNYRDMQDTLRVVRDFGLCPGVTLKLSAKTSDMYDQMAQVFGDNWVDNWGDISLTVGEYLRIANDTANRLKGFITHV